MKNSISLYAIAIVIAISTVVRAQHRAPAVPFIDTIQYGNTILIQSSMYSGAMPIPYEGANPKEVYRAAKSGKKLVTTKENILFNLHSVQTITEYVYQGDSWKSLVIVTDLGIQKETIYCWIVLLICFIASCLFLISTKFLFYENFVLSILIFLVSIFVNNVLLEIVLNKMIIAFNSVHILLVLVLFLLVPFIIKIKIRKNKKDTIVEPSPQ